MGNPIRRAACAVALALAMATGSIAGSAWAAQATPGDPGAAPDGLAAALQASTDDAAPAGPTSLANATVALSGADGLVYTGKPIRPAVRVTVKGKVLSAASDYSVAYRDNVNAGTATVSVTGKGAYAGTASKTFAIGKAEQKVTTSKSKYKKTYGAVAFKLKAKTSGNGKLTYQSSKKRVVKVSATGKVKVRGAGKAKVKVSAAATANYKGASKTVTVKVKRKSLKSAKVKLSRTSYAYNGKAHKPKVTVKAGKRKLAKGSDYKLVYKRNVNAGTASVYVKGKGNYKGTKKATFTITAPVPDPEPTIVEPEPEQPATTETVYITRTGECYHLSWCSSLRRSSIPISLGDAISRGYRPCHICNP